MATWQDGATGYTWEAAHVVEGNPTKKSDHDYNVNALIIVRNNKGQILPGLLPGGAGSEEKYMPEPTQESGGEFEIYRTIKYGDTATLIDASDYEDILPGTFSNPTTGTGFLQRNVDFQVWAAYSKTPEDFKPEGSDDNWIDAATAYSRTFHVYTGDVFMATGDYAVQINDAVAHGSFVFHISAAGDLSISSFTHSTLDTDYYAVVRMVVRWSPRIANP